MRHSHFRHHTGVAVAAAALLLLSACNDDNQPRGSTVITNPTPPGGAAPPVSPPPVAKTRVTLQGKVVDEPIPNATVQAVIGSTTVTTVADAAGNYTLPVEVPTADADLPVVVTATGVGAQASVTLVSLPGDVTTLLADAGSDGIVTPDENIRSNVTHVSTAEAVLVMELLDGSAPTSQGQLDDLLKQVDPVALFDLAATIKLIVDTAEYGLPEGVSNTLAFAQNVEVRNEYIEEIKEKAPEDLEDAKQDTANSADAVMQTTAADVPTLVYAAIIDNDANFTANQSGFVSAYTFNGDGTGTRYSGTGYTTTTWALANNQITVTLNEPAVFTGFPIKDLNGDGEPDAQVRATTTVDTERLTLLSDTLVSVTVESSTTYPDGELPDETESSTDSRTLLVPATDFAPFLPSNFASTGGKLLTSTYLPQDEASGADQFSGDIFTLSSNGTATAGVNVRSFNWALTASGALTFNLPGNASVVYNGLDIDYINQDAQTSYVLAEVTTANAKYVDVVKVIAQPQPLVFDTANLPGEFFQYGLGNQSDGRAFFDGRLMGFSLQLFDDRTGFQGSDFIRPDGTVGKENLDSTPEGFFRWSLGSSGIVAITRHFDTAVSDFRSRASRTCDPAASSTCQTFDRRELIPFGVSGSRFYWLERRQVGTQGAIDANSPFTYLQRYYDMTTQSAAIVGSWQVLIPAESGGADTKLAVSFMGNGKYVLGGVSNNPDCKSDNGGASNPDIEADGNGWEKGDYRWNPSTGLLSISNVTQTDGTCGLSEGPGANFDDLEYLTFNPDGTLKVRNQASAQATPVDEGTVLRRIASAKRSLTGGWVVPEQIDKDGIVGEPLALIYFFPDNSYLNIEAQFDPPNAEEQGDPVREACGNGGIELGRFNFDAATGKFFVSSTSVDTNGAGPNGCGADSTTEDTPLFFTFITETRISGSETAGGETVLSLRKITTP